MIRFSKAYPSFLTVKEGSTFLTKPLFNSLYDPFGSPSRGQKPQGREDVTALRCSEPLCFMVGGASKPSPGCAGWDRLNCSSLQYRSALVVARMRNIFLFYFWEEYHATPNRLKLVQDIACRFRWWRRYLTYSVLDFADSVFGFRNMMVLNIISELSRFPHFQSRWLLWLNSI